MISFHDVNNKTLSIRYNNQPRHLHIFEIHDVAVAHATDHERERVLRMLNRPYQNQNLYIFGDEARYVAANW